MFRPKRQARYLKLKKQGFLPFEAFALSKVPTKTPYFKMMTDDRKSAYKTAKGFKFSKREWTATITDMYKDKGFGEYIFLRWKSDVWTMFRSWEERYRERYPDYTSPWQKKKRKRTDFIAKFDRGERKYPRGRHY